MAKRRIINTKMWSDGWFADLDPVEKLLFIYLLTNERTNLCGIYELPLKIMAVETGIEREMIEKVVRRFTDDKKVFCFKGWVFIANFVRYQEINPSIKQGITRVFSEIPEYIKQEVHRLIPDWGEAGTNLNLNFNLNSNLNLTDTDKKKPSKKEINPDLLKAKEIILKYIPIDDIDNKTNQRYLKMLYDAAEKDISRIEILCRGIEFFKKSEYPYTIYSVRSLYDKRKKISARMETEQLKLNNKKPAWITL